MATMPRTRELAKEEQKPLLSGEADNIFDGLSFPEPPTSTPIISSVGKTVPYRSAAGLDSRDTTEISVPVPSKTLSDSLDTKTVIRKPPVVAPKQSADGSTSSSNNFKVLYISEKPPAASIYPMLPEQHLKVEPLPPPLMPRNLPSPSVSAPSLPISAGDVEMKPWGKHMEKRAVNAPATMSAHDVTSTPTVFKPSAPPSAPPMLLSGHTANSSLKNAVEEHKIEGSAYAGPGRMEQSSGPVITGLHASERVTRAVPKPVTTESNSSPKYVCCGGCKQWLAAPRDAKLVFCPGCEAINDCSLAEGREGRRTAARKLEAAPWYLQCFQRLYS